MTEMSKEEIERFVMQGTFTGKLATVRKDGGSHVVPIWFVLDNENNKRRNKIGNITFTTYSISVFGTAKIHTYKQREVLKWAIKIAGRYMGKKNAEAYGRRNSGKGAVLVQINPTKIIAEKDIASWD
jgi:hypothetical protein